MSADSRVVGWQWEHFVNNGLGGGYWIDQSGHEYPEILDQSDLKDPNKYRNMTALVPLSLLAEAERGAAWLESDAVATLRAENVALQLRLEQEQASLQFVQAKLDAVVGLADRWEKLAETHGIRAFTGNDHRLFANELRAALGGELGNEEVV